LSDAGLPLRNRTPPAKRLSAIPSCAGLMTRLACARAKAAGIDLPPLLRRVRLSVQDIEDESIRLSVATQIQSLNVLAEALNDRLLGFHLGRDMDLRRTGFLYYVAASSDVLGHALQELARCATTLNEGVRLEADLGETLRVGFAYAGVSRRSDRHQIEAWITAIVRCCREISGRDLAPLGARIMHQRIAESAKIDSFLGCSVEFGADRDEISLPGEAAKLPVVNADRFLNKLVIGYCEEVVSRRKARSGVIQADVENAIAALLPHGETRIENVAQKLRVSPRTLRRKLAAEGVTFAGILEDLRFALAKYYLAEQDLSISRIAWLLGYTEVSAFSHAFRRWTGRTPRADRSRRRPAATTPTGRRVRR
jgi:AraC-like DNA-binding protein